jgi:uncharacterized protein
MQTAMLAPWKELFSGLFAGIVFGFLLRKAHVTRSHVIIGQLLLKDFTVMKVMITALIVGSAAIYGARLFDPALSLEISSTTLLASLLGGGIFGVGMAILGFCPGTAVGALADGRKDMGWGLLGMVAGAALYAESFEWIRAHLKRDEDLVKTTLPEYFNISPWLIIGPLLALGFVYLALIRKKKSVQA